MDDAQDLAAFRAVISVDLESVFYCMRYEIPAIAGSGGSVVNIASVLGVGAARPQRRTRLRSTGVIGVTKSAAAGHSSQGVRVNAVRPAYLHAGLTRSKTDAEVAALITRHSIGRFGTGTEVAAAVTFLMSDDASFITGTTLVVDGGYRAL